MSTIRITKEFSFEGAHALVGYDGKCKHIHGHSYKLFVTVKGTPSTDCNSSKLGMLIDFTDLKKIINEAIINKFDHAFIVKEGSPLQKEIGDAYKNVKIVPFQPTCENLVIYFSELISGNLPQNTKLLSLKLYETATSYVEWYADDNK
jgi:6-pyruvoyltetrahydropterin/6-carboxytetrahydropterin synthase